MANWFGQNPASDFSPGHHTFAKDTPPVDARPLGREACLHLVQTSRDLRPFGRTADKLLRRSA
jgi:hypothetical protein